MNRQTKPFLIIAASALFSFSAFFSPALAQGPGTGEGQAEAFLAGTTAAPQKIIVTDAVTLEITGLYPSFANGLPCTALDMVLTNTSEDELLIQMSNLFTNDYYTTFEDITSLPPNSETSYSICNSLESLSQSRIPFIAEYDFTCLVYRSRDRAFLGAAPVHVETSRAGEALPDDHYPWQIVYNTGGIEVKLGQITEEKENSYEIHLHMDNHSQNDIAIELNVKNLNGVPITLSRTYSLAQGRKDHRLWGIYKSTLAELGLAQWQSVTAEVAVRTDDGSELGRTGEFTIQLR